MPDNRLLRRDGLEEKDLLTSEMEDGGERRENKAGGDPMGELEEGVGGCGCCCCCCADGSSVSTEDSSVCSVYGVYGML